MTVPEWRMADDGKSLLITFPTQPPISLHMDTEDFDEFIKNLMEMRQEMEPPITRKFEAGSNNIAPLIEPDVECEPGPTEGSTTLRIKDPRIGWFTFVFKVGFMRHAYRVLYSEAQSGKPH